MIINALAQGKRVEIRRFATFSRKKRKSRTGRNPRTRETVSKKAKYIPRSKQDKS